MNFTREPMIETVITPREGMKLLVRSSKGGQEEYLVEAVEVVSFGQSLFFRSLERPKSFLVPVSDYEILELKETRMPLKAASPERSIKIGGGKEMRPPRETLPEEREPQSAGSEHPHERGEEQRKRKRRRGRRGGRYEPSSQETVPQQQAAPASLEEEGSLLEIKTAEEPKAPSFISKLFPPPPTLIKETLSRYKLSEPLPNEEEGFFVEESREEKLDFSSETSLDDQEEEE